jgi:hypothetical protein
MAPVVAAQPFPSQGFGHAAPSINHVDMFPIKSMGQSAIGTRVRSDISFADTLPGLLLKMNQFLRDDRSVD